jgi:hypothetical protein
LPIAASRTGLLDGTVATVGFSDIGFNAKAQSRKDRKVNTVYSLRPGIFASLR